MKRLSLSVLLFIVIFSSIKGLACTTVIISGNHTTDGRPVLWKHRDSDFMQNKMMYFKDGQYDYIGLVNSVDKEGKEVWGGYNSSGFAIMNSASYNLNINDTTKLKDQEGVLMKKALQSCSSLEEFEQLLNDWPKPLGVEANFGVIDAHGGAAYYETTNFEFRKFEVNDPKIAPYGYLVRSNHSVSGERDKGYGYIRFQQAENLFFNGAAMNRLNAEYIITQVTRDLHHALTDVDLTLNLPHRDPTFVPFEDFIPRYSSTADIIVQGAAAGENPQNAMLWTILGFQLCSVAVPLWIQGGSELPPILTANEHEVAPLCDKALKLKDQCFPIKRGSGYKYLNLAALMNQSNTGIWQKLKPLEDQILRETKQRIKQWKTKDYPRSEIQSYYRWLDQLIQTGYQELFGL